MDLQSNVTSTAEGPEARTGAEAHLQGAWLMLARIVWVVITLLAIGLFVASLPSYFAYLHIINADPFNLGSQLSPGDVRELQSHGLSLDFYAWLNIGVSIMILVVYAFVGAVLFWRKSD